MYWLLWCLVSTVGCCIGTVATRRDTSRTRCLGRCWSYCRRTWGRHGCNSGGSQTCCVYSQLVKYAVSGQDCNQLHWLCIIVQQKIQPHFKNSLATPSWFAVELHPQRASLHGSCCTNHMVFWIGNKIWKFTRKPSIECYTMHRISYACDFHFIADLVSQLNSIYTSFNMFGSHHEWICAFQLSVESLQRKFLSYIVGRHRMYSQVLRVGIVEWSVVPICFISFQWVLSLGGWESIIKLFGHHQIHVWNSWLREHTLRVMKKCRLHGLLRAAALCGDIEWNMIHGGLGTR